MRAATAPAGAVANKRSAGGTAPERVAEQMRDARAAVARTLSWLGGLPRGPGGTAGGGIPGGRVASHGPERSPLSGTPALLATSGGPAVGERAR